MDDKIEYEKIPKKHNAEDKIFNLCDIESPKFIHFITNIYDVVGPFHRRYLSDDYKDLNLDHVSIRANGDLVHGEHHSKISGYVMRRNFQFLTSLHLASKRFIHPFIFNTGSIPKNTIEFASSNSFYNPVIINTQEIEESVR